MTTLPLLLVLGTLPLGAKPPSGAEAKIRASFDRSK